MQLTPPSEDALPEASTVVALPDELLQLIFKQACNVLDPGAAVAFSSASHGLWAATQALLPQLKADHEAAAAFCRKLGMRGCKELREAKEVDCWYHRGLTAIELGLLLTLGSVLPALETLALYEPTAGPDAMQRLAAGLCAGALPAVSWLQIRSQMGDTGALALAAALGQGAMPRLKHLHLSHSAIGDAGLVALAPAFRRLPALNALGLQANPLGDEGLAALVLAPSPPAGAPPPATGAIQSEAGAPAGTSTAAAGRPPTGVLTNLQRLYLSYTQITDAGCAALTAALESGALPALERPYLRDILASDAALAAVYEALDKRAHDESDSESESE